MNQRKKIKSNKGFQDCSTCELPAQLLAEKKKLKSLAQSLFKIQENERRQFSHELHDEIGQWLTAIYMEAVTISSSVPKDANILVSTQSIKESVGKTHKILHNLMHQLRPALLDTLGLEDSLQDLKANLCSHNPTLSCRLVLDGKINNFSETLNITIYRIIQEALNNVCMHAEATRIQISLNFKKDISAGTNILLLEVVDNGRGFNYEVQTDGFGVLGMRERANAVGGEFSLYSVPGKGTQINVRFSNQSVFAS